MKSILTFLIIVIFSANAFTQSIFDYNGYLQNMQTVWVQKDVNIWALSGSVINRFNFHLYPSNQFTFNLSLRNILDYGQTVQSVPNYDEFVTHDNGYFNLTKKWSSDDSYVLYTNIDRFNILFTSNNLELQLGRQRINLGINFVWTPNDIFNSTSYLNFDYVERQGSDAARAQYYLGIASSIEFVYKLDFEENVSSALIFKFNEWDYDFQIFSGLMVDDYVFGGGWSGNISGANFSGELTYFRDKENFSDTTGQLVSSIGATYTFPNDIYIHGEFLYNSTGTTGNAGGFENLFTKPYNAKNLSPAKYSLFGDISYPITPLIQLDLSSIFNPSDKSFYIGPFVDISLTDSIYLLFAGQFFFGDTGTEWGDFGEFYYLRMKWNF